MKDFPVWDGDFRIKGGEEIYHQVRNKIIHEIVRTQEAVRRLGNSLHDLDTPKPHSVSESRIDRRLQNLENRETFVVRSSGSTFVSTPKPGTPVFFGEIDGEIVAYDSVADSDSNAICNGVVVRVRGEILTVQISGVVQLTDEIWREVTEDGDSIYPGLWYYVGVEDGKITHAPTGDYRTNVGYAISRDDLLLAPSPPADGGVFAVVR